MHEKKSLRPIANQNNIKEPNKKKLRDHDVKNLRNKKKKQKKKKGTTSLVIFRFMLL
jgi:hypothetical protein